MLKLLINNYHIVQNGENLTEISNKYNLKAIDLIEINNLNNPDSIKVGQQRYNFHLLSYSV